MGHSGSAEMEYVLEAMRYLDKLKTDIEAFWSTYQRTLDRMHESRLLLEQVDHLLARPF
jgi:hypothetical protein